MLNNIRQYQTTFVLHERGMIDDDLFDVEMKMAARNLQIPGVRQWWEAGGKNQMLPRFRRALESTDPGDDAHWAWTKEHGFVSRDQIEESGLSLTTSGSHRKEGCSLPLRRYPVVHAPLQYVERQRARAQQVVMECAHVELVAELCLGAGANRQDLQLTDLVCQCLAGVTDVAINFIDDVVFGLGGIVLEEIDRLLARPALVMHARVDDEAYGTPHFVGQRAEA